MAVLLIDRIIQDNQPNVFQFSFSIRKMILICKLELVTLELIIFNLKVDMLGKKLLINEDY
jgi:hypothetical protein